MVDLDRLTSGPRRAILISRLERTAQWLERLAEACGDPRVQSSWPEVDDEALHTHAQVCWQVAALIKALDELS